jgi:MFS family permease
MHVHFVGFSAGCICQLIGSLLGFAAMYSESSYVLFIGCLFVGFGQGLGQFYRFAAVEISPEEFKGSAVTYVLTGGVLAAFLGPTSATYSVNILPRQYAAPFLAMGLVGILNLAAVSTVNFPPGVQGRGKEADDFLLQKPRPLSEIMTSRMFVLSCTIATMAHTVMVMVMSNCALSMDKDYGLQLTSLVMQFHFFSMFAPGFITGRLISTYGPFAVSVLGSAVFGLSSLFFALGMDAWNYFVGMILLGLGWNFSFSAGTVMLTQSYMVSLLMNLASLILVI